MDVDRYKKMYLELWTAMMKKGTQVMKMLDQTNWIYYLTASFFWQILTKRKKRIPKSVKVISPPPN